MAINILVLLVTCEIQSYDKSTNYYHYLWPIETEAQQLQEDSINFSSNTIQNVNSLPELFSMVEKSVVQVASKEDTQVDHFFFVQ